MAQEGQGDSVTTDLESSHKTGQDIEQRVRDLESKLEDLEFVVAQLVPVQKGGFRQWLLKLFRP